LRQKRAIFCQFFSFLKAHSSATQLKKGEKMAKKSRFLAKQPNRKQALKSKTGKLQESPLFDKQRIPKYTEVTPELKIRETTNPEVFRGEPGTKDSGNNKQQTTNNEKTCLPCSTNG
jgi:hypothetical protein